MRETIGEEDMALLADTLEGETNLFEAIDTALAEIDETEVLISGLKEKETQFSARRRAMEERLKRFRALIEQAMAVTEQMKLRRPAATLTLRTLPPDVVVLQESEIPSEFFVPQPPPPPKLDKAALRNALKARQAQIEAVAGIAGSRSAAGGARAFPGNPRRHPQQWRLLTADQEILMLLQEAQSRVALAGSHLCNQERRQLQPERSGRTSSIFCAGQSPTTAPAKSSTSSSRRRPNTASIPFRRQIMPLVFSKDRPEKRRMVIVVGIDGQRIIAQRCGNYRPASEPTKFRHDRRKKGPTNPLGLISARVTLFQQDNLGDWFPVVGEAFWDELAPIRDEWEENRETGKWKKTGRQVLDGGSSGTNKGERRLAQDAAPDAAKVRHHAGAPRRLAGCVWRDLCRGGDGPGQNARPCRLGDRRTGARGAPDRLDRRQGRDHRLLGRLGAGERAARTIRRSGHRLDRSAGPHARRSRAMG